MKYKLIISLVLICLLLTTSAIAAGETSKKSSFWDFLTNVVSKITSIFVPTKTEAPADQVNTEPILQQTATQQQAIPQPAQLPAEKKSSDQKKCGDGVCDKGESKENCPADCGGENSLIVEENVIEVPYTDDNKGAKEITEADNERISANSSCIAAGVCQPPSEEELKMENGICGDGVCSYGEDCSNCEPDCSKCSDFDLSDFPYNLIKDEKLDAVIVIGGDILNLGESVAATDFARSLGMQHNENGTYFIKVEAPKFASQIKNIKDQNVIIIGSPCDNLAAEQIMGKKDNCHSGFEKGKGKIKVYESNGKVAIVVAGYEREDTNKALVAISDYKSKKLKGKEFIVE